MKAIVTLTRMYKKEVEIEVEPNLIKGMSDEEIATFLMEEHDYTMEDDLFELAEFEQVAFDDIVDTDRYDIYNENGKNVYGGHL
jgi:hypothetical protein